MKRLSERCVEESWEQLQERLHRVAADLQEMLDQINSKRRPVELRRAERSLRARLRPAIRWIDQTIEGAVPETVEEAELFVMCVYELDELLPELEDDFHWLLEASGEDVFLA
jgi:hypothetical protein